MGGSPVRHGGQSHGRHPDHRVRGKPPELSRDNYGDERGGVMVTGMAIAMGNGDDDVMALMTHPPCIGPLPRSGPPRPPHPVRPAPGDDKGGKERQAQGCPKKAEARPNLKPPARHPGTAARREGGRASKCQPSAQEGSATGRPPQSKTTQFRPRIGVPKANMVSGKLACCFIHSSHCWYCT